MPLIPGPCWVQWFDNWTGEFAWRRFVELMSDEICRTVCVSLRQKCSRKLKVFVFIEFHAQRLFAALKPEWCLFCRLGEEVGGLFLQASPCAGMGAGLAGVRDSGYDSLHRRLSVLDRLVTTHGVWLQLDLSHQEAADILQNQPTGVSGQRPPRPPLTHKIQSSPPSRRQQAPSIPSDRDLMFLFFRLQTFLVRKSLSLQRKVISVRMNKDSEIPVTDFPVKESQYSKPLCSVCLFLQTGVTDTFN